MSFLPKESTLDEMKECLKKRGSSAKRYINPSLIEIELRNCVPDELHHFLGISDVILCTLFTQLIRTDKNKKVATSSELNVLQRSVKITRNFWINFNVCLTDNTPNSRSGFEFTAKVIKGIPWYFDELLSSQIAPSLVKLWMVSVNSCKKKFMII
jgi:hypothetical protein